MEAKLVVVGGKANKAEVTLKLPTIVGRGRDADLTVAHATVSRHHCLLFELEGALIVRDNGSLNGTVVEGERVSEAVIKPGETLTVGPLTFRADYAHRGEFPRLGEQPAAPATASDPKLDRPDSEPIAACDTPGFGFLGNLETAVRPGEADAPPPEITLHDPEAEGEDVAAVDPASPAAGAVSGEYAISLDSPARASHGAASQASHGAASQAQHGGAAPEQAPAGKKTAEAPKIDIGSQTAPAAAPEDDELNNFFESIGLD